METKTAKTMEPTKELAKDIARDLYIMKEIAQETYIWGFPIVLMDVTRKVMTNTEQPNGKTGRAPINQFGNAEKFPKANYHDVVRPNFDTLYSFAWLDLSEEPLVMTLPATDVYNVFEMMDAWTEVFAAPGTRMTGRKGGNYLVAGPAWNGWKGDAPGEMELLRSPTNNVWIIGRIQTNGIADYNAVHQLQSQISLCPLSQWGNPNYVPPNGKFDPLVDLIPAPMTVVEKMNGEIFFTALMKALLTNLPHIHDQGTVERMKRLGLKPGQSLDFQSLPPPLQNALNDAAVDGLKAIQQQILKLGVAENGWNMLMGAIGYYGADYLTRAAVSIYGLGANRPEDAIYPGSSGDPLSGANCYSLHFPKWQTPPVNAFWSVTLYDEQGFAVENSIKRYALHNWDNLTFDTDGSLTLYIQNQSPGADKESNWLPAPTGVFTLLMRCYSPRPQIASGEWIPPAITKAAASAV